MISYRALGQIIGRSRIILLCGLVVLLAVLGAWASWPSNAEKTNTPMQSSQSDLSWVQIPGDCFEMGDDDFYREEAPTHRACVDDFELTRTEITNAQFSVFVEATGYQTRAEKGWKAEEAGGPGLDLPPSSAVFSPSNRADFGALNWWKLIDGASWRVPNGRDPIQTQNDQDPVVHITRADAIAYASWAGARLPTEQEWEFAALGRSESWRKTSDQDIVTKANTWQGLFPISNSGADGFEGIAPVASFPANEYGLYDMIGNVWEWTSTPFSPDHSEIWDTSQRSDGYDPSQPGISVGTIKGGSFLCAQSYCYRFRPAARQAQDLAFGTSHTGFRLARTLEQSE